MKKQIIIMLGIFLSILFVTAQTPTATDSQTVTVTTEQPAAAVDSPVTTEPVSAVDPAETISQLPTLQDGILNKPGNNPILYLVIGLLVYLTANFRMMALRNPGVKFNLSTWISGNYIKIILYVGFIAFMFYTVPALNNFTAFALGFVPAKGIDWMKKELNKFGIDID